MMKTFATVAVAGGVAIFIAGCGQRSLSASSGSSSVPPDLPNISMSGPSQVRLGGTAQFSATITGETNTSITWKLVAPVGEDLSVLGSISSSGLYTAPQTMAAAETVSIVATSQADAGVSSATVVTLLNPSPQVNAAAVALASTWSFSISVTGTGFLPTSQLQLNSAIIPAVVNSPTSITATISTAALQSNSALLQVANPDPGGSNSNSVTLSVPQQAASVTAAARLLDQATFGPTFSDIQHVQQVGTNAYIQEQLIEPPSVMPTVTFFYSDLLTGCKPFYQCIPDGYWTQFAIFGPDQLRQRVAFALSKMWVVSYDTVPPQFFPYILNIFSQDAFSNWRQLMQDVTLTPAMGTYLNSANNLIQSPSDRADQNFARENLQLFNLGPIRLNQDGSVQTDANGAPIPTYTQDQIAAFSKVFTGFTYPSSSCTPSAAAITVQNLSGLTCSMYAIEEYHDHSAKALLNGVTLPAGQTAGKDLSDALDNVFQDSNMPPFISTYLIQNLVKSNPSPSYIKRVADVFVDDGNGVRGNMAALITAILTDPEARAGDDPSTVDASSGHLRDPILWTTALARSLNPAITGDISTYRGLDSILDGIGEPPHTEPSVFGFYSPSYVVPGTTVGGPEFELETSNNVEDQIVFLQEQILAGSSGNGSFGSLSFDLSATGTLGALASQGVSPFLDGINILYYHGTMSGQARTVYTKALQGLAPEAMVKVALYIVALDPAFRVIH